MYRGYVILAQNAVRDTINIKPQHVLKEEYEGVFVDVWYKNLSHIKGQHVYYNRCVYKVLETCLAGSEFDDSKYKLVVRNVKLLDDQNTRLEFHRAQKDDTVLNMNKLYSVIETDESMPYSINPIEDLHIDIWYPDLEYEKGQHVWHEECVYIIDDDLKSSKDFDDFKKTLVYKDIKLFADSDKNLFFIDPRKSANVLYYNKLCSLNFAQVHNYVEQACLLASSIKKFNEEANITIITDDGVLPKYQHLFEHIMPIPLEDDAVNSLWKVENRWKIYDASPYDQTIVMDADMVLLEDISHWWDYLQKYDLFFTSNVKTYRNETITSDYYRKVFTKNDLPNIYTGLHFFKKSEIAEEYYILLKNICKNWQEFYKRFLPEYTPNGLSMDVAGALAIKILDIGSIVTSPNSSITFTHMKAQLQNWQDTGNVWSLQIKPFVNDRGDLKIGNYLQNGLFHYTEEDFLQTKGIENLYE